MTTEFKVGDEVIVVRDGSEQGSKKPAITNGDRHTIKEIRADGMVMLAGLVGWYLVDRFEAASSGPDPSKPFPDPEADAAKTAADRLREYRKGLRDLIGDY